MEYIQSERVTSFPHEYAIPLGIYFKNGKISHGCTDHIMMLGLLKS